MLVIEAGAGGAEPRASSDRIQTGLSRSDPDGFFDAGDEDFAIADAAGLSRATDRLDRFLDHVVAEAVKG